jgi:hypothetical protein
MFGYDFRKGQGAIWTKVRLPPPAKATAYWTALYGTYLNWLNWLTTTLAAVFGTAARSPISAAGHSGQFWQENLLAAGFLSVSVGEGARHHDRRGGDQPNGCKILIQRAGRVIAQGSQGY